MPTDLLPDATRASAARWLPWVLATAVLLLGAAWTLATPPLTVVDEEAHALYAVSLVHGQLRGTEATFTFEEIGVNRTVTTVEVPQGYADSYANAVCHVFKSETPASCAPSLPDERGAMTTAPTTAGTYPPPWYLVVGLPSLVLSPDVGLYAMRLVEVLLVAAAVGAAAASLRRRSGTGWRWLGLAVAVTPMTAHLAGGVNPNGAEIAVAILLWCAALEVVQLPVTSGAVVRLAVAAASLAVLRPVSIAWLVGILLLVAATTDRERLRLLARHPHLRLAAAAVAVVVAATITWLGWRHTLSAFQGRPDPQGSLGATVSRSLDLTTTRLEQMVGRLGYIDVVLPAWVLWSWYLAVPAMLVAAWLRGRRRTSLVLALLAVGVVALPVVAEVRTADVIGFAWQGRYSLPLAVGVPLLAGIELDRRGVGGRWAVGLGGLAVVTAHVASIVVALHRYEVGTTRPIRDVLGGAAPWEPPFLPDTVLVLLAVAGGLLAWSAVAVHLRRQR